MGPYDGPLATFWETPHEPRQSNARSIIVCFRDYQDVERIMSYAHILQSRKYGINRDCPDEAVKARFRLWADYKNEKHCEACCRRESCARRISRLERDIEG